MSDSEIENKVLDEIEKRINGICMTVEYRDGIVYVTIGQDSLATSASFSFDAKIGHKFYDDFSTLLIFDFACKKYLTIEQST